MIALQLLGFVFCMFWFLNMVKNRGQFKGKMQWLTDVITVGVGMLTFWQPLAYGWIG